MYIGGWLRACNWRTSTRPRVRLVGRRMYTEAPARAVARMPITIDSVGGEGAEKIVKHSMCLIVPNMALVAHLRRWNFSKKSVQLYWAKCTCDATRDDWLGDFNKVSPSGLGQHFELGFYFWRVRNAAKFYPTQKMQSINVKCNY